VERFDESLHGRYPRAPRLPRHGGRRISLARCSGSAGAADRGANDADVTSGRASRAEVGAAQRRAPSVTGELPATAERAARWSSEVDGAKQSRPEGATCGRSAAPGHAPSCSRQRSRRAARVSASCFDSGSGPAATPVEDMCVAWMASAPRSRPYCSRRARTQEQS
jgi:hypothetical protein